MFIYTPITTCMIKKVQMQSIQAPGIFKFMINSATKNNKIKDNTNIAYHVHTIFYLITIFISLKFSCVMCLLKDCEVHYYISSWWYFEIHVFTY